MRNICATELQPSQRSGTSGQFFSSPRHGPRTLPREGQNISFEPTPLHSVWKLANSFTKSFFFCFSSFLLLPGSASILWCEMLRPLSWRCVTAWIWAIPSAVRQVQNYGEWTYSTKKYQTTPCAFWQSHLATYKTVFWWQSILKAPLSLSNNSNLNRVKYIILRGICCGYPRKKQETRENSPTDMCTKRSKVRWISPAVETWNALSLNSKTSLDTLFVNVKNVMSNFNSVWNTFYEFAALRELASLRKGPTVYNFLTKYIPFMYFLCFSFFSWDCFTSTLGFVP